MECSHGVLVVVETACFEGIYISRKNWMSETLSGDLLVLVLTYSVFCDIWFKNCDTVLLKDDPWCMMITVFLGVNSDNIPSFNSRLIQDRSTKTAAHLSST